MCAAFPASRPHSRRGFVAGSGAMLVLGAASGCDAFSTDPARDGGDARSDRSSAGDARQAPALADAVKDGKLLPLKDRLPNDPLVVKPTEGPGPYGGTWTTCTLSVPGDAYEMLGYDPLLAWDPAWTRVLPNIARAVTMSDDARRYTFKLRTGMRWSDGHPFTADDVVFAYDDVLRNTAIFPAFPDWLMVDGEPGRIDKVDDQTFTMTFVKPYALLTERLATPDGNILTALPKHYFSKFHHKYNPDADRLAKNAGQDGWADLFIAKGGNGLLNAGAWQTADLPTLLPWRVTTPMSGGGARLITRRNPYYWKVDPQGRQLPYLDRAIVEVVSDPQVAVLRVGEGRYSLPTSDLMTLQEKPVLAKSREKGRFHFADWPTSTMNEAILALNLNHPEPGLREVFSNKDFRIGLSYAINRKELIKAVYQGQGEPWQVAPRRECQVFNRKLATQYTAYGVQRAGRHLDRAGYSRRDGDGFRLGPDGERIAFTVEIATGFKPTWVDTAELLRGYCKAVGVDLRIKQEAQSLFTERAEANQHDAVLYDGNAGLRDAILDPTWYFPYGTGSYFAVAWARWYSSGGKDGERPPSSVRQQMTLYDQLKATPDEGDRRKLYGKVLDITQRNFYAIGTVAPAAGYNVVQDAMHNVPTSVPEAWLYPDPGPTRPEQFYFDE